MNIKAIIPAGLTELTVNGLHQWDYGRKIEIHSPGLPALVEVHFACAGMTEAVVRSCPAVNGVAVAAIPDRCLEQTSPITAWVYVLDGTSGITIATINLTIEPRTRPCPSQEIPEDISDKYTEAVGAMNAQVDALKAGDIQVAAAKLAGVAEVAQNALNDKKGNDIAGTYLRRGNYYSEYPAGTSLKGGIIAFLIESRTSDNDAFLSQATVIADVRFGGYSPAFSLKLGSSSSNASKLCHLNFTAVGSAAKYTAHVETVDGDVLTDYVNIEYKHLSEAYT